MTHTEKAFMGFALGFFVASSFVEAQPYITYENGTVYQLAPQENIYVSRDDTLFRPPIYRLDGAQVYAPVFPEATNDEPLEFGSPEWCEANVPAEGVYTFATVTYNKYCTGDN